MSYVCVSLYTSTSASSSCLPKFMFIIDVTKNLTGRSTHIFHGVKLFGAPPSVDCVLDT